MRYVKVLRCWQYEKEEIVIYRTGATWNGIKRRARVRATNKEVKNSNAYLSKLFLDEVY